MLYRKAEGKQGKLLVLFSLFPSNSFNGKNVSLVMCLTTNPLSSPNPHLLYVTGQ